MVEHLSYIQMVLGSSPSRSTGGNYTAGTAEIYASGENDSSRLVERGSLSPLGAGSSRLWNLK